MFGFVSYPADHIAATATATGKSLRLESYVDQF
jgi:hypothetical protein